jgi:hypothetical protein
MTQSNVPQSKLYIRSEVLAAIDAINRLPNPSRGDKLKQLKRLQALGDQACVISVLVKELQRTKSKSVLTIISELLMELGNIETLKDPLWGVIQNQNNSDDVKDTANIVLRHLGDVTDPSIYLDYLEDPAGLINRETARMLEISAKNPEALIDFIDFIFSLPVDEQLNLIQSLQKDYSTAYTLNIFIPGILAKPPQETMALLITILGNSQSARAAKFLQDHQSWFQSTPELGRVIKNALNKLRMSGALREELLARKQKPHPLLQDTKPYKAFATIADGIGNSAIILSREHENGELLVVSVAISDIHGVIDCFGFYDLSKNDFDKLLEKLHEENTKIQVPISFCLQKLAAAERLNYQNQFRIPYEYVCWKVVLETGDDPEESESGAKNPAEAEPVDTLGFSEALARPEWMDASNRLYQHPDFSTWFLEEGDHPVVTDVLKRVLDACEETMQHCTGNLEATEKENEEMLKLGQLESVFISTLDAFSDALVHGILNSEWREILMARLADAAYLLNEQKAFTFAQLAATEVIKLREYKGVETPLNGFIKQYGRRCVEEDLLRLKQEFAKANHYANPELFEHLVDQVLTCWEF